MNKENKLVIRILKRILLLAVVMFLLSVVVFWLARLAPGDPLQSFYGDSLEMMTSGCGQNETGTGSGDRGTVCKVVYQRSPW